MDGALGFTLIAVAQCAIDGPRVLFYGSTLSD
jgi:hypothetical protein